MEKELVEALELHKDSTVACFLKELEGFSDDDELLLDPHPQFYGDIVMPFTPQWEIRANPNQSPDIQKDSKFVNFSGGDSRFNSGRSVDHIKVGEFKKVLAPIVCANPDLIICFDKNIKSGALKRTSQVTIPCDMPFGRLSTLSIAAEVKSLAKNMGKIGISDPAIIHNIIMGKYPKLEGGKVFIVGDQIFSRDSLL